MEILTPILVFGVIALIMGIVLGIASKLFAVDKDPKIALVAENLPGANCGGCGYAGCEACAVAIVKGEAPVDACPGCSSEAFAKICEIMGIEAKGKVEMAAFVNCCGNSENAVKKYHFDGTKTCSDVNVLNHGDKACIYACLGYGDCKAVCAFNAITIKDGIADIDRSKCVGCGMCEKACPKGIITLLPKNVNPVVKCSSKDKGIDVKDKCKVGCIACRICEKNCPNEAIKVVDNLAVIDYDKCTSCGICAEKCPKKIIKSE